MSTSKGKRNQADNKLDVTRLDKWLGGLLTAFGSLLVLASVFLLQRHLSADDKNVPEWWIVGEVVIGLAGSGAFVMGGARIAIIVDERYAWLRGDPLLTDALASGVAAMFLAVFGALILSAIPFLESAHPVAAKSLSVLANFVMKFGAAAFVIFKTALLGSRLLNGRGQRYPLRRAAGAANEWGCRAVAHRFSQVG